MADAEALLAEADISAERLIARIRMIVAVLLFIAFLLSVNRIETVDDPMLQQQLLLVGATIAAYFLLGAAAWAVVRAGLYRLWLSWVFAACDVAFLALSTLLSLLNTGLPGGFAFIVPSIWLIPIILAFGALRYRPALQATMVAAVVVSLTVVMVMIGGWNGAMTGDQTNTVLRAHSAPPAVLRSMMIVLAGAVLAIAVARARRLLMRAIEETRRRADLTRFLPAEIAAAMSDGGLAALRRGRLVQAAVMFIDMRGFTSWAETRSCEEVSELLTDYRERLSGAVSAHGGLIDKFIGDGALVVFGAVRAQAGFADNAIQAGLAVLDAIGEWSERRIARGDTPIAVGIGIHAGDVFVGAVGDESRLEFTVLGNVVNVASRLEQLTKAEGYPLIVSKALAEQAGPGAVDSEWVELGQRMLDGQHTPVSLVARGPRYGPPSPA